MFGKMSKNEATDRIKAAMKLWREHDENAAAIYSAGLMCGDLMFLGALFCAGFAVVATAGLSMWFGPVTGLAAMFGVFPVWSWLRRDARVKYVESEATKAFADGEA